MLAALSVLSVCVFASLPEFERLPRHCGRKGERKKKKKKKLTIEEICWRKKKQQFCTISERGGGEFAKKREREERVSVARLAPGESG